MTLYEQLQECIDKKKIISIIYSDTNNYHQIKPLELVTANRGKVYLRAISMYFNKERTYLIDKIRSIEETSLKFSETEKLKAYNPYLNNIKSILSNKEVKDNKKLNEEIDNEIIKYYIKALKLETLMEVAIDYRKEKVIYIDKNDCISCSLSSDYEINLKYHENKIMQEMIEILSQYPDNTIYLGYPYISINSLLCPIIFQKVIYDVDKQSIHIEKGSTVLNYKLFSKDLELDEEEIEEIKEKILSGKISELIEDGILSQLLYNKNLSLNSDKGFIFIEKQQPQNVGLLYELRKIAIENKENDLINGFFKANVIQEHQKENKHIYNVVKINDSQREAVCKSHNTVEIIKGSPGTGKTQTIINLICNYVLDNKRVLVASQNNKAVDNVFVKLKMDNIYDGVLRLGNSEIRDKTLTEILESLKDNNKLIHTSEKFDIDNKIEESKNIQSKIDLIKSKIQEMAELKLTSEEMLKSIEALRLSIIEVGLDKHIDSYESNIDELNKNIAIMNGISCLCEKFERKRNKNLWRLLSKLNFNYDKFRIKQLIKSLNNIKSNLYGNMNFDIILDVKDCADGNIMLMEHTILQYKYNNIINRLNELKEKN